MLESNNLSAWREKPVACADPECAELHAPRLTAEPESDDDVQFFECTECGYTFGFEQINSLPEESNACPRNIPEELRRQASEPMEKSIIEGARSVYLNKDEEI